MNENKKELFERALALNRQIYRSKSVPGDVYEAYNSLLHEIEESGWAEDWIAWKAEQPEEDEAEDE